jgi:hypothetical protein
LLFAFCFLLFYIIARVHLASTSRQPEISVIISVNCHI